MARNVIGVIVGYIAMAAVVFGLFTAAYLVMGADRAFQAGSYDVTPAWLAVWFVGSLVAAVLGGWVCARIAKSAGTVTALAALVVVLGILSAVPHVMAKPEDKPTTRTTAVGNFEAMTHAQQPLWVLWVTPVLGAAGVLIGGRR